MPIIGLVSWVGIWFSKKTTWHVVDVGMEAVGCLKSDTFEEGGKCLACWQVRGLWECFCLEDNIIHLQLLISTLMILPKFVPNLIKNFMGFCLCMHWVVVYNFFEIFSKDESPTNPKDKFKYPNLVAL